MTAVARRRSDSVTPVILAAGGSSRLGTPKQFIRLRGRALLRHAADAACRVASRPPVVVVGAEALRLRVLLRRSHPGCIVVTNTRWRQGMAGSVEAGLRAVPRDAQAVLFLLADQPFVDAAALGRLLRAWRTRPGLPAAAGYSGRVGVPAVIPRRLLRALRGLRGDTGARALLAASTRLTVVELPEAAFDVDLPADLTRLSWASPPRPVAR
jgi:molybdenum cofactor cytidylyltransferase